MKQQIAELAEEKMSPVISERGLSISVLERGFHKAVASYDPWLAKWLWQSSFFDDPHVIKNFKGWKTRLGVPEP